MLENRRTQVSIALGLSLCALLVGATVPVSQLSLFDRGDRSLLLESEEDADSAVLALALLDPDARADELAILTEGGEKRDRLRARYLLAVDRLSRGQADGAIEALDGLEKDYDLLAPYILLQRAKAYETQGNTAKATETWQELAQSYSDSPVIAEAYYTLGKNDPTYWDRAIAEFPAHPRTVEIARTRLKQNPTDRDLLLLVARHGIYLQDYGSYLERLVQNHGSQLTPEQWEAIAFGYWEKQDYGNGAKAYAKAPRTAENAYRAARGLQIDGKRQEAREAYRQLIAEFPDAEQSATGLLRLASLLDPKEAIPYLDRAIANFPDRAGDALFERSRLLDSLGSNTSAQQARQSVLTQYSNSDAAAKIRWNFARERAAAGDYQQAWQWAQELGNENPDHELAPQAGFWVGKWAGRLGRQEEARQAFEHVLKQYPQSYYAWRSALYLGWNVGDFTTVRPLTPQVVRQTERVVLPAGSDVLKELYKLGRDREAWNLWQVEFTNRPSPSVAEQFTDGVIRLGVGDNLDALFMVSSLAWRDRPEEREQYKILKQQPHYWEALYPFPFLDPILEWSRERQLNPLLVTALIRQESRFMPKIRSVVDATGLMQVMPETGEWIAQKINLKDYDLEKPEDNIKLGTWFLAYTHEEYNDNSLLAVASYNAGPGAVAGWLDRFGFGDADEFVEKIPYPETRGYVEHVFENYWNYLRLYNPQIAEKMKQL
jgi:soluble lytic murein transglycosylase